MDGGGYAEKTERVYQATNLHIPEDGNLKNMLQFEIFASVSVNISL